MLSSVDDVVASFDAFDSIAVVALSIVAALVAVVAGATTCLVVVGLVVDAVVVFLAGTPKKTYKARPAIIRIMMITPTRISVRRDFFGCPTDTEGDPVCD